MGGVVFALLSWPGLMAQWIAPRGGGAASVLPPLEALRAALSAPGSGGGTPLAVLARAAYPFSDLDVQVLGWINTHVLAPLGTALRPGSFDVLVGHVPGGIGTVSAPLLLLGAWFLLSRGILRWHLPVFYAGTFGVLTLVFGGLGSGQGWFARRPGFSPPLRELRARGILCRPRSRDVTPRQSKPVHLRNRPRCPDIRLALLRVAGRRRGRLDRPGQLRHAAAGPVERPVGSSGTAAGGQHDGTRALARCRGEHSPRPLPRVVPGHRGDHTGPRCRLDVRGSHPRPRPLGLCRLISFRTGRRRTDEPGGCARW